MGNKGISLSNSGNLASAQPQECLEHKGILPSKSEIWRSSRAQECLNTDGSRLVFSGAWHRLWLRNAWEATGSDLRLLELDTVFGPTRHAVEPSPSELVRSLLAWSRARKREVDECRKVAGCCAICTEATCLVSEPRSFPMRASGLASLRIHGNCVSVAKLGGACAENGGQLHI